MTAPRFPAPPAPDAPLRPGVAESVVAPRPPAGGGGRSIAWAGAMLGLGALLLASTAAFGLASLLGPGAWAAPLAAAVGVLAGGLPLLWVVLKLAREAQAGVVDLASVGLGTSHGVGRPLFMDLAHREWARARRYGSGAALLLVDIDRYARLCEARGAAAGEAVMAELLRQVSPTLRPADMLTRYSESQMAVFLAHADATGALDVAERIRECAEKLEVALEAIAGGATRGAAPAAAAAQRLRITVSAGVAHLRPAHLSLQSLVDDAEDATAMARQAGGNCVRAAPVESARRRASDGVRGERRGAQPRQDGPT